MKKILVPVQQYGQTRCGQVLRGDQRCLAHTGKWWQATCKVITICGYIMGVSERMELSFDEWVNLLFSVHL
ncbi:hypothetical protein TNCV_4295181 [Trichonephila clavipes]|uniref:Uncharacterized protein n=1 Tax=Trichonephila clavipes TaxID=2585209 RepID=A0A8X6RKU1_TRICX|nr:hypothetical protein TNCV_4295181 [Trichonephila clavipes]